MEAKEAAMRRRANFGSAGSHGVGDAENRWLEKTALGLGICDFVHLMSASIVVQILPGHRRPRMVV
jgi:hypothetical protein